MCLQLEASYLVANFVYRYLMLNLDGCITPLQRSERCKVITDDHWHKTLAYFCKPVTYGKFRTLITIFMVHSDFHRFAWPTSAYASLLRDYPSCAHKYSNEQSCFERLASADVDRCNAMKLECTIKKTTLQNSFTQQQNYCPLGY